MAKELVSSLEFEGKSFRSYRVQSKASYRGSVMRYEVDGQCVSYEVWLDWMNAKWNADRDAEAAAARAASAVNNPMDDVNYVGHPCHY
jgi:hypothetical protein